MSQSKHHAHIVKLLTARPGGVEELKLSIRRQYRNTAIAGVLMAVVHGVLYLGDTAASELTVPAGAMMIEPLLVGGMWLSLSFALLVRPIKASVMLLMMLSVLEVAYLWSNGGLHRIMLLDVYILVQCFFCSGALAVLKELEDHDDYFSDVCETSRSEAAIDPQDAASS